MNTSSLARGYWISVFLVSLGLGVCCGSFSWSQGIDLGAGQSDVDIRRRSVNEDVPGDRRSLDDTTKRDHLRVSPTTPNLVLPESERNALESPANGLSRGEATYVRGISNADQHLLEWVLVDQAALMGLAQYGMTRTESTELRQLAELVFQHHRAFAAQLARYRPVAAVVPGSPATGLPVTGLPATGLPVTGLPVTGVAAADGAVGRHVRGVGPTTPAEVQAAETRENNLVQQRRINDARREAGVIAGPVDPVDELSDMPLAPRRAPLPLEMEANAVAGNGPGEVVESARSRLGAAIDTDRGVRNEVVRGPEAPARVWPVGPALDLRRKISERLATLVRDDLQGKAREDFDQAFLGYLVAAHLHQEATLDIVRMQIDGPFEEAVNDAFVEVRRHRAIAERMQVGIRP